MSRQLQTARSFDDGEQNKGMVQSNHNGLDMDWSGDEGTVRLGWQFVSPPEAGGSAPAGPPVVLRKLAGQHRDRRCGRKMGLASVGKQTVALWSVNNKCSCLDTKRFAGRAVHKKAAGHGLRELRRSLVQRCLRFLLLRKNQRAGVDYTVNSLS